MKNNNAKISCPLENMIVYLVIIVNKNTIKIFPDVKRNVTKITCYC